MKHTQSDNRTLKLVDVVRRQGHYAAILAACITAIAITAFLYFSGALLSEKAPWYFTSLAEYRGILLTIIIIPTYLIFCFFIAFRKSLNLADQIDRRFDTSLFSRIQNLPSKPMLVAFMVGTLWALLFNVPGNVLGFLSASVEERSVAIGQIFMWGTAFSLLLHRIIIARAFTRTGASVPIDIFVPERLNHFAQNGLIDVLTISGAMILTMAQSLDFSFRFDNYSKSLAIAGPAILYLSMQPMWDLHKRMQKMQARALEAIGLDIAKASKVSQPADMQRLETLLQRRDRLSSLSTWPINVTLIQRFILYVVLPPLAWVGAALVEELVTG